VHLLSLRTDVARIICLVRADTDVAALERVEAATKARLLTFDKVEAYAADLGERYLGLGAERYLEVQSCTTTVIHVSSREIKADGRRRGLCTLRAVSRRLRAVYEVSCFSIACTSVRTLAPLNSHCMPWAMASVSLTPRLLLFARARRVNLSPLPQTDVQARRTCSS
jgi:hypothetical protein